MENDTLKVIGEISDATQSWRGPVVTATLHLRNFYVLFTVQELIILPFRDLHMTFASYLPWQRSKLYPTFPLDLAKVSPAM